MSFHRDRVIELVTEFYRANGADEGTKYLVISNVDEAVRVAEVHGPDPRLADALPRSTARSVQELDHDRRILRKAHELVLQQVVQRDTTGKREVWLRNAVVMSAGAVGGLPRAVGEACHHGMGWLFAAKRTAIIVPSPVMRFAEGQPGVLHDDTGRMAVVSPDGHGS